MVELYIFKPKLYTRQSKSISDASHFTLVFKDTGVDKTVGSKDVQ